MFSIRRSVRVGVAALALPVLVACGVPAAPASPAPVVPAEHNDADIQFAQAMIPHHQQAVEMAEIAADRTTRPEITELAEQIRAAQDPEITTLTGFLQAWGAEVPETGSMSGMDHGAMPGMSGMVTPEQMEQMGNASGAEFDTMFLQMMIVHHEGAIADARRELTDGVNPEAKALAQQIADSQTAEITRMRQLLAG